jgi:two-component system chemotaxis response regulator CheB
VKPVRVAIADDSALFRAVLRQLLEADGDIRVVGEAADGERAIELVRAEAPDLLTVDMQMPGIGGLETIAQVMARTPVPVLVVTGQPAAPGSHLVFEAIRRGALEIVEKGTISDDEGRAIRQLVRRLASVQVVRHLHLVPPAQPATPLPLPARAVARDRVAIAASSGGPSTLAALLAALPPTFPACIAVVQHLPVGFAQAFARFLREHIGAAADVPRLHRGGAAPAGGVRPGLRPLLEGAHPLARGHRGRAHAAGAGAGGAAAR